MGMDSLSDPTATLIICMSLASRPLNGTGFEPAENVAGALAGNGAGTREAAVWWQALFQAPTLDFGPLQAGLELPDPLFIIEPGSPVREVADHDVQVQGCGRALAQVQLRLGPAEIVQAQGAA